MKPRRDDRQVIELFANRANELLSRRLVRSGFSTGFSMNFRPSEGMTFSAQRIDEEDFRSLLLTFRLFTAQKEDTRLERVFDIFELRLNDTGIRDHVRWLRAEWKLALKRQFIVIKIGDHERSPEQTYDLILNSLYFHSDVNKTSQIESLGDFGLQLSRQQILNLLAVGIAIVAALRELAAELLGLPTGGV
jgi:hypothetical protein